jgi:hypothetical protein
MSPCAVSRHQEAAHQRAFGALLAGDAGVHVPAVVDALSTPRVLVTHLAKGQHIDAAARELPQATRDQLARRLLRLTLRELFEFRCVRPPTPPQRFACPAQAAHVEGPRYESA